MKYNESRDADEAPHLFSHRYWSPNTLQTRNVSLSSIPIFCSLTSPSFQVSLCLNSSSLSLFLPPTPSSVCLGTLIIDVHNIFSCTPSILLLKQASFAVSFLFCTFPPRSLSFLRLLCQERATSTAWQLPIILHYSLSCLLNPNERCCYKFSWIWRAVETNWSMYSLSGMLGKTYT